MLLLMDIFSTTMAWRPTCELFVDKFGGVCNESKFNHSFKANEANMIFPWAFENLFNKITFNCVLVATYIANI